MSCALALLLLLFVVAFVVVLVFIVVSAFGVLINRGKIIEIYFRIDLLLVVWVWVLILLWDHSGNSF